MMINKEKVKKIANIALKKASEKKEATAMVIFGGLTGIAYIKAIKNKKEKGVPEGYENDAKNIIKECDWIVMAQ